MSDKIRITVDDADAARALLSRRPDVSVAPANPGSAGILDVTLTDGSGAADVNDALVRGGVRVHALEPQRDTLEDVFLHLVEGIDVPR